MFQVFFILPKVYKVGIGSDPIITDPVKIKDGLEGLKDIAIYDVSVQPTDPQVKTKTEAQRLCKFLGTNITLLTSGKKNDFDTAYELLVCSTN